jgi:hypothetical protein
LNQNSRLMEILQMQTHPKVKGELDDEATTVHEGV